jgi:cellulose biosynthesis protein BcsQ/tetratricopeptide (TPR) repeat protein
VIVTFYSFKGGTGRTMALANIAVSMAKAGNRVLAVDFDLEAPGLWRFFQSIEPDLDRRDGLLDLLTAHSKRGSDDPVDWREYVTPLTFDGGWISLMTSGRADASYAGRVLDFNWQAFFQNHNGGRFIERLRGEWAQEYDFVFIDSRTGITDTGGVCTIALPDLIVPVLVANHQNVDGVLEVLKSAQEGRQRLAYDRPPALVLPILSRFDSRTEYRSASEWLDLLAEKLAPLYADWLPVSISPRKVLERTKLPYIAYFSFGEKLPVLDQSSSDPESLGYALDSAARLIAGQLRDVSTIVAGWGRQMADAPAPAVSTAQIAADAPLAGRQIIGGVPPLNPNFTGRDELLRELRSRLRRYGRAPVLPVTLQGLGGVGKTQLAAEYARRFQADYELIWWIPSDDEPSVRRSFGALARGLGLADSHDVSHTVNTVLDELRIGRPTPNWLLIYDGVGEPSEIRRYLPSGPGHVLITSRSRSWISQSTMIELDVFTLEESVAFLTRRWTDIGVEDARMLGDELGNLPLALEQAVAVHTETGMPLPTYLRLLTADPGQVLADNYDHSVARTLRLAVDQLTSQSPAAAQLLEVCSFLSSHPISVPMLVRGRGATLPPELSDALQDDVKMRRVVREIGRYALAQLDTKRDTITIHKLVRVLVRDGLGDEQRALTEHGAHQLLALANPGVPDNEATWAQHAEIAPHVIPSGVLTSGDPHVRGIVVDQIRYLFVIGNYADSAGLAERAKRIWEGTLGPDNEMTLVVGLHLGNALRQLGDYERARAVTELTLPLMREVFGPDDEHTLRLANSLGADLRLLGAFRDAFDIDRANLERYQEILRQDDPATLRAANNLAVDYRLLGDFGKARIMDEDTFRLRSSILGYQNAEVLSSANSLVHDLYGIGLYDEALALQRDVLARSGPLASDHAFVLLAKRNLAILLRKTGDYAEAVNGSEANLEAVRRRFGGQSELSLSSMMTLSNALRAYGDLTRASVIGERVLRLYRAQFHDEHPYALCAAVNLAIVYRALGRFGDALEMDRSTFERLDGALGSDHPYVLCCATGMGNDLGMMGRSAEARQVSERVFEQTQRVRGPDHPYTLACAANLALDLDATGSATEAAELRQSTVDRSRRVLGSEHPETADMERGRRADCEIEVPQM